MSAEFTVPIYAVDREVARELDPLGPGWQLVSVDTFQDFVADTLLYVVALARVTGVRTQLRVEGSGHSIGAALRMAVDDMQKQAGR